MKNRQITTILTTTFVIIWACIVPIMASAIEKCSGSVRVTCVVDGDTFWLDGEKYRPAGFDAPETTTNFCGGQHEKQLGDRATDRLIELFNTQPMTIEPLNRRGRYGRELVILRANGQDVGDILINEGLARQWPDGAEFWCN